MPKYTYMRCGGVDSIFWQEKTNWSVYAECTQAAHKIIMVVVICSRSIKYLLLIHLLFFLRCCSLHPRGCAKDSRSRTAEILY